jgi:hypothetical protein
VKRSFRQSWAFVCVVLAAACGGGGQSGEGGKTADDAEHGGGEGQGAGDKGSEPGSGAGAPSGVTIAAPDKGTKARESRNVEMNFDLTLLRDGTPAGMQGGSWSLYEERTLEVAATSDNAISKLQLSFGRREAKALLGVEKPSAVAGKVYVVEAAGGEPSIKAAGGKDAPAAEQSAVAAEYGWVGQPSPLLSMLASMKTGDATEPPVEARRVLIGELPSVDHEKSALTVKLVGVEGERKAAKLDVKLVSELDNGDMLFTLELSGAALVDTKTGWVKALDLNGTVKAKGTVKHKKGPMEAKGKGTVKITRKTEFI